MLARLQPGKTEPVYTSAVQAPDNIGDESMPGQGVNTFKPTRGTIVSGDGNPSPAVSNAPARVPPYAGLDDTALSKWDQARLDRLDGALVPEALDLPLFSRVHEEYRGLAGRLDDLPLDAQRGAFGYGPER